MFEFGEEDMEDVSALFSEIQDLLSSCQSARAFVNKLPACTCTKGKGDTRSQRRLCDHCQALAGLGSMRRKLEALKERCRPNP